MKAGHLIAAAIEMVIKVVVIAAAIIFIFQGPTNLGTGCLRTNPCRSRGGVP